MFVYGFQNIPRVFHHRITAIGEAVSTTPDVFHKICQKISQVATEQSNVSDTLARYALHRLMLVYQNLLIKVTNSDSTL